MVRHAAVAALLVALGCGKGAPPSFRVLTFNVLCSFCDTKNYDPWNARVDYMQDVLARHDPDLFGLQEIFTADEVKQIADRLPGYANVYFHDADRRLLVDYPDATLFYRQSTFELRERGVYWLSETPDTPWTYGWAAGGQFFRLVAWARLLHKPSGRELYAATVHVDNNHPNQERSAPLMLQRAEPFGARMPVVLVGDFNSKPGTDAYATLTRGQAGQPFALADAYELAERRDVVHDDSAQPDYDAAERIDHVFLGGPSPWRVKRWAVDLHRYGPQNRYPSDHFAISADVALTR